LEGKEIIFSELKMQGTVIQAALDEKDRMEQSFQLEREELQRTKDFLVNFHICIPNINQSQQDYEIQSLRKTICTLQNDVKQASEGHAFLKDIHNQQLKEMEEQWRRRIEEDQQDLISEYEVILRKMKDEHMYELRSQVAVKL
jgi:hypothetical protein